MNSSQAPGLPQAPYRFSKEEERVLQECNSESFFQRCLPLSASLGAGTFLSVKNGYLSGHAKFGAAPKVIAAVIAGYILGKVSYQGKCMEKLMALPDSKLAAALRDRRRGFTSQDSSVMDQLEGSKNIADVSGIEVYNDTSNAPSHMGFDNESSSLDNMDSYPPQFEDHKIEDEPVQTARTTSYDELRRRNREAYGSPATRNQRSGGRVEEPPADTRAPTRTPEPIWTDRKPHVTNKYGDSWEN